MMADALRVDCAASPEDLPNVLKTFGQYFERARASEETRNRPWPYLRVLVHGHSEGPEPLTSRHSRYESEGQRP